MNRRGLIGFIKGLLFFGGLALIGLGFTELLSKFNPLLGFVSNEILSIVIGALLVLFVLWRFLANRKKRKLAMVNTEVGEPAVLPKRERGRFGERRPVNTEILKNINTVKKLRELEGT